MKRENLTREELLEMVEILKGELMDSTEVREYLGVPRQRIHTLIKNGRLTPVFEGYFLKKDIEAFKQDYVELQEKYTPNKYK